MRDPGTPTLDQLRIFLTVVETGSFAAAGRRLRRATSVVSYAIDNLEAQLGLPLFQRAGTRRPTLTEAGRTVLAEARTVAHGMDGLRAKVKGLLGGLEAELDLAVDVLFPACTLVSALAAFQRQFPTVALHLHMEALGGVTDLVLRRRAALGVTGTLDSVEGIARTVLGHVEMIPVAAPGHPLAAGPNCPGAGRDHVQLVLTDRSPLTEGRSFSVIATRTWRLADIGAKHNLLKAGLGWGGMPLPMVEEDIAAGRLVRLDMPDWPGGIYPFQAIWRTDAPPGPAARWLMQHLAESPVAHGRH